MGRIEHARPSELLCFLDGDTQGARATTLANHIANCPECRRESCVVGALSAAVQDAAPTRHEFSADEVFLVRLEDGLAEQGDHGRDLVAVLPPLVLSVSGALACAIGLVTLGLVLAAQLGMMEAVSTWLRQVAAGAVQLAMEALPGSALWRQGLGAVQYLLAFWRTMTPKARAAIMSGALSSLFLSVLFTLSIMSAGWTLCWSSIARQQQNGGS